MININFDKPLLLLLLIPLLLIVILSYIFTFNKDNRGIRNIISFAIHITLCILITLTITKTTLELIVTKTEVYVLADLSYSSRNSKDIIDEYIENIEDNLPRNSKMGVICFGKDSELLVPLGEKLKSVKHLRTTTSVYIASLSALGNTYTAEVDVYIHNPFEPNEKPKVQRRVVTIQVAHRNNFYRYNKVESNPYGFYVAVYKERKKR